MKLLTLVVVLCCVVTFTPALMAGNDNNIYNEAEIYQLEQLHAAFHQAASVQNNVTGDSQEVIDDRINAILSLWTKNAVLDLKTGSPFDGFYIGRGNLNTDCPVPSMNPKNQGRLCTLFKYVAGSFQSENKFISLTSAFKQHFSVDGNSATFYFECHYFNVDDSTGTPPWTAVSHVALTGTAIKVNGEWKFSNAVAPTVGVPTGSGY